MLLLTIIANPRSILPYQLIPYPYPCCLGHPPPLRPRFSTNHNTITNYRTYIYVYIVSPAVLEIRNCVNWRHLHWRHIHFILYIDYSTQRSYSVSIDYAFSFFFCSIFSSLALALSLYLPHSPIIIVSILRVLPPTISISTPFRPCFACIFLQLYYFFHIILAKFHKNLSRGLRLRWMMEHERKCFNGQPKPNYLSIRFIYYFFFFRSMVLVSYDHIRSTMPMPECRFAWLLTLLLLCIVLVSRYYIFFFLIFLFRLFVLLDFDVAGWYSCIHLFSNWMYRRVSYTISFINCYA